LIVIGNTSGTNTGDQSSVTGNAGTATALQTPRAVNGVAFDGTAAINTNAGISQAAETFYVATAGNGGSDSNPGTALLPFLTIQHALDVALKRRQHPLTIQVGAGTFAGAYIQGFTFETGDPSLGSWVRIVGTYKAFVPATGTASGTTTSAFTTSNGSHGQVIDSVQAWTVNDLRGKLVRFNSGALIGILYPIQSNDATSLTCAAATSIASGVTYDIVDWDTVINTGVVTPPNEFGAAVGTIQYAFNFSSIDAPPSVGQIRVEALKVTTTGVAACNANYAPKIINCRLEHTSTAGFSSGVNSGGFSL
jgi:hypothetical protein